jgi:hypothetical protein
MSRCASPATVAPVVAWARCRSLPSREGLNLMDSGAVMNYIVARALRACVGVEAVPLEYSIARLICAVTCNLEALVVGAENLCHAL